MSTEPADVPGWGLFAHWHALIDRGDPRFRLVASVREPTPALAELVAELRSRVWNMQRHSSIESARDSNGLDASARRKGLEFRFILPRRVAQYRNPLASSHYGYLRLAPVAHPMIIGDGRRILVGDATGETIWTSSDPGVVSGAVRLYDSLWQAALPAVPEGEEPPFTRRMVDIAVLLVDGATDREIARKLGVSERTVSADVRAMSHRLGARSRAHAIALVSAMDG